MKQRAIVSSAVVIVLCISMLSSLSYGGGVPSRTNSSMAQLGVRTQAETGQTMTKVGQAVETTVINADKLIKAGFTDVKRDDKVTITLVDGNKFAVKNSRTGQTRYFKVEQSGGLNKVR